MVRLALSSRLRGVADSQVRLRVTIAATVVAAVAAVLGSVGFVLSLRHSLEQALITSAAQQAAAVSAQLDHGSSPARAVISGIDDVTTQIVSRNGRLIASDRPILRTPLRTSAGVSRDVPAHGLRDRFIVVAVRNDGGDLVVVGRSEEHVHGATETAVSLLLIAVPIGLVLLAMVIWVSLGRALRPVEGMRREATSITSEHLHRRLPVPGGNDEISSLARTLNEMLDRIDVAARLQRQFVSDASHELRSPLATLRQLAEVAIRRPDTQDMSELAHEVLAEEQRMEQLVTALLTLARVDDAPTGALPVVDLEDVVIDEVSRMRATTEVHIATPRLTPVQVRANPILVSQLVRNLLSNAVRHAVANVQVSLEPTSDMVSLVVDDDGVGILEQDRERVFERFVRLDEARTRDAGGSGLGLAIVRKVAEESGGGVRVVDSPLGGARLAVTLPSL